MQQFVNLLNGEISSRGASFNSLSIIDNQILGQGYMLFEEDLNNVFEKSKDKIIAPLTNLDKLAEYIRKHREAFVKQIVLETGYIKKDSEDIVDGSIELVTFFDKHMTEVSIKIPEGSFSHAHKISRKIKILQLPYGIIAAMTPQNAPLILELTLILNALAAGNSIILRPSSQCVGTVTLLIKGLIEVFSPEILGRVSIVSCKATDFLKVAYKKADLIHYIGSSLHGERILQDGLSHNRKVLVDGEGSSTIVIDNTAFMDAAVEHCFTGIIRSNGELCSTVRTIVVEESIYEEFSIKLAKKIQQVVIDNPFLSTAQMGPVFHEKQAKNLQNIARKYELLAGSITSSILGSNYITPFLCKLRRSDTRFLQEQLFGPFAGIVPFKADEWKQWITGGLYHLNDAVISNNQDFINEFIDISLAPRIVINNDPSIESVFEAWGAFLPNGQNDVSFWYNKYVKNVQLDYKI